MCHPEIGNLKLPAAVQYKKATKEYTLSPVKLVEHKIIAYGGSELCVVGRVLLLVRCGNQ